MSSSAEPLAPAAMQDTSPLENFRLLASAIAAKSVSVHPAGDQDKCWTDSNAIFVPKALSFSQMRDACIAQALFIRGGGIGLSNLAQFIGRPKAAHRYFAFEVLRVIASDAALLPAAFERRAKAWYGTSPRASSPAESAILAFSDKACAPDLPAHFGTFRPARLWSRRRSAGFLKANQVHANRTQDELASFDEDEETENVFGRAMRRFSSPLSAGDFTKALQEIFGLGRSSGTSDEDASDGGSSILGANSVMTGQASDNAERVSGIEPADTMPRLELVSSQRFPEWDSNTRSYKRDWTSVHTIEPVGIAHPADNFEKSRSLLRALRFVGADAARHPGETDGEEFDVDRIVRMLTERGHGPPRDDLFVARRKTRRDLSVSILIDSSHSTGDAPDGEPVLDKLKAMTSTLSDTLQTLGARVAVHGFHSWGRHDVRMLEIKRFTEPFSNRARARLSSLEPAGLTRLGTVVRAATQSILKDGGARYKLGILLTDGFAYDDEYEGRYAEEDARKALQEAEDIGVAFVCVAVGGEQESKILQNLFGHAAYMRCATLSRSEVRLKYLIETAFARTKRPGPSMTTRV